MGKGVISEIIPDSQMPTIEHGVNKGKHAEIILNPLGVLNRKNPSQLFEHEINFIMNHTSKKIKRIFREDKTIEEKIKKSEKIFFGILSLINTKQSVYTKTMYKKLNPTDLLEFWELVKSDKFYIHQAPFYGNINFNNLVEIYRKYKWIKPFKFAGIERELIMGKVYYLKLRHHPKTKFSTRSTSYLNIKNTPSKSITYKANQQIYSKTPIRMGKYCPIH